MSIGLRKATVLFAACLLYVGVTSGVSSIGALIGAGSVEVARAPVTAPYTVVTAAVGGLADPQGFFE